MMIKDRFRNYPVRVPRDTPNSEKQGRLYVVDLAGAVIVEGQPFTRLKSMGAKWAQWGMLSHRLVALTDKAWRWNPVVAKWQVSNEPAQDYERDPAKVIARKIE